MKKRLILVLGIRPDTIRTSILIKKLIKHPDIQLDVVYTGQHYDEELMGIFFREMKIPPPTIVLDTTAPTHVQQHAKLIVELEKCINVIEPDAVMFLGDANAVMGCIAPLKMGVPIIHVEAGSRSHDFSMPEERNRKLIDSISDVLYCYQHDYKCKLVQEGICPTKIEVVGNTIVDVIDEHLPEIINRTGEVLDRYKVESGKYALMTMHRNENVSNHEKALGILTKISNWSASRGFKVILPVMPRLKPIVNELDENVASRFIFTKPLGFLDFVALEKVAAIEFTDSGTNQEVASILGTPCIVLRKSTERPETFKCGTTFMTDSNIAQKADYALDKAVRKEISLGDGDAAERIIEDLVVRLKNNFHRQPSFVDSFILENWTDGHGEDIYG